MIEHIRKYSGLMIFVLVLIFISFFFMDAGSMQGTSGSPTVLKIDGRSYNEKDYRRLGAGAYELIGATARSGDFGLYQAYMPLFGRIGDDDIPKHLLIGRAMLHKAKDEFGIHPNDEEISTYIRKMRSFSGPDGNFDPEIYRNFIERSIGRLGMTEHDLRELAADAIVAGKLQSILAAGLGTDRDAIARSLALDEQEISVEIARLDLDTYQDKIDPQEEEIKAYWESIQDSFKTEPLRKFTYVLVSPAALEEPAAEPSPAPLPADASEEDKAAAKKAEEEKTAARAASLAEARRANQTKTDALVDDFLFALEENKGAGFEDLAKANGWEVKTTEPFSEANPPADLNIDLRSSSLGGKAVTNLFLIPSGGDAFSKLSEAIPVGDGQWLVARLDAEEPARVKTYAEARADARAQYILEKGSDALKAATEEAATKIKEALAAGKSFEEAAKEAGITEIHKAEKISRAYRPNGATEPQTLFEAVRSTDPGSLANNIFESDRAFIVHVVKREVVKNPDNDARIDAEVRNSAAGNEFAAFNSWLNARIEAAKIDDLTARR